MGVKNVTGEINYETPVRTFVFGSLKLWIS